MDDCMNDTGEQMMEERLGFANDRTDACIALRFRRVGYPPSKEYCEYRDTCEGHIAWLLWMVETQRCDLFKHFLWAADSQRYGLS